MGAHLSTNRRHQLRVLSTLALAVAFIRYSALHHPLHHPQLARLNERLKRYQPFHLILATLTLSYASSHLSLLTGINAPLPSLSTEPDMHYSPSFSRVRYVLTAFDAAVLSTLHIASPPLRHLLSSLLGLYYVVFRHQAERKLHLFRSAITTQQIRAMWNKGCEQPLLRAVSRMARERIAVDGHRLMLPVAAGSRRVECSLYYHLPLSSLRYETALVLQCPGGGFISMPPAAHADYLCAWAAHLRVPVLSVNYAKAPEQPYPAGLLDCYDVYREIVVTEGRAIGMNGGPDHGADGTGGERLRIALVGDSSGGNLAAALTLKAIDNEVRLPAGIHLIYPCLDFGCGQQTACTALSLPRIRSRWSSLTLYRSLSLPADVWQYTAPTASTLSAPPTSSPSSAGAVPASPPASPPLHSSSRFHLSSRSRYLHDGVLPALYQMRICQAYLAHGGDPFTDYYISPLRAPSALLSRFPPLFVHVGEVDPLLDDSVGFVKRVREAKGAGRNGGGDCELVLIEGVSHAYLHMAGMLPEAREAVKRSEGWLSDILQLDQKSTC